MASDTDTGKAETGAGAPLRVEPEDRPGPARRPGPAERAFRAVENALPRFGGAEAEARTSAATPLRDYLRSPLSTLTRRIVAINLAGLAVLVAGVLYLNQLRDELIAVRVQSLESQARVVATAIAELAATAPDAARFDIRIANEVLRQLTFSTGQRAQIYMRGRLMGDTRSFEGSGSPVETKRLPPLAGAGGLLGWIEELYSGAARIFAAERLPVYSETPVAGITRDAEVYVAARGEPAFALRANAERELIVSVAVPIQRLKVVMGVLTVSTAGGDIDRVIRAGRLEILRVFIIAAVVSILLSGLLASGIARPLRRLAQAADAGGVSDSDQIGLERVEIPDFTARGDEIGHLSGALRRMTSALYTRIEAIESFAADVAHEIKNPLTSLRSAVETMRLAKTDESRERLLQVIEDDVRRMDRLLTDISNASRLDAELVRETRAPFDMGALAETLADMGGGTASDRGVRIETSIPPAPLMVRGLESRLAQVISNLIANGVSFSPEGGVLRVILGRDPDGAAWVRVEDEGPGVPPENLENIFERFYTERPDGEAFGRHSGLGLSISRQIAEAHGGTVHAENIKGENDETTGARFVLRLPA